MRPENQQSMTGALHPATLQSKLGIRALAKPSPVEIPREQ